MPLILYIVFIKCWGKSKLEKYRFFGYHRKFSLHSQIVRAQLISLPRRHTRQFFTYQFKGTVSRDFLLLVFFSWISFPPAPEYSSRTVLNFFENSWRYLQVKVHHRYQRHQWRIFPPVLLVLLIPVANLPLVSTILAAKCHRYQWHRRQIATGIKDTGGKFATGVKTPVANNGNNYQTADNLKWTWRKKFIYMLTLLPKDVQNK